MELFNNNCGTHRFILCHPKRAKRIKIKFDKQEWFEFVPVIRRGLTVVEVGDIKKTFQQN